MPQIIHYRTKCIGCFGCVAIAPDHWRMSKKDGQSVLLHAREKKGVYTVEIEAEDVAVNRKAASLCPARVIQVRE